MRRRALDLLDVYREEERVGRIERTPVGATFVYESHVQESIAFHLPRSAREVPSVGTNLHPFFAGLLPEGMRLRVLLARSKASNEDLLSLLAASGSDCIGDISVLPQGRAFAVGGGVEVKSLKDADFDELLQKSLESFDREPTIPGVQEKIPASMVSIPVRTKGAGAYILKLNPKDKPDLVQNEHYFSRAAKGVGLVVPHVELVTDARGRVGLLAERFDRVREAGRSRKLHQEDGCQLLNRYPADKYSVHFGDLTKAIVDVTSAPVVEVRKLLHLLAFSYVVGNGDLHARNVSVLRTLDGWVELSPVYDVLSTVPYGDRSLALKIDGRDDNLKRRTFVEFGERFGVRKAATTSMLDALCHDMTPWIDGVDAIGLSPRKAEALQRLMKKRRRDLG